MARYIDADKLLENLKKQYGEDLGWQCTVNMSDVGMMIEDAPTADVVEVVRCKDCKHCWHLVPDYTYPDRTDEVWECVRTIDWVEPDHFCGRGERRTE